jgi:signal transduction histidine kinase
LCVLDKIGKEITPEKIELLKIIADEIVNRFNALRVIQGLRNKVKEANETKKRVAHDIRGPLGGIINLAQLISEQGDTNKMEEVLMFISMIQKSGSSLLDLADEILSMEKKVDTHAGKPSDNQLNLLSLKDKLEKLYAPQALNKKINFSVTTSVQTEHKPFLKNKLLQIIGNLISNAIKFTPQDGTVSVNLNLETGNDKNLLLINVSDTGVGLDEEAKQYILSGSASSTQGTNDEQGYGFGLALVKHLVTGLNGTMDIQSTPGEGATFTIAIPQNRL